MKRTITISASQMALFRRCPRAWGYYKLGGYKGEETPAMAFGTRLHKVAEEYLVDGILPVWGSREELLVNKAIKEGLLPLRTERLGVEERIDGVLWPDLPQIRYIGYIDCVVYSQNKRHAFKIIDHKTTGSWKWAKNDHTLKYDPQVNLYGLHMMRRFKQTHITVEHIQYLSKGRIEVGTARAEITLVGATEVVDGWREDAKKMLVAYEKGLTALDLPRKLSGCSAFGGCQHRAYCKKV